MLLSSFQFQLLLQNHKSESFCYVNADGSAIHQMPKHSESFSLKSNYCVGGPSVNFNRTLTPNSFNTLTSIPNYLKIDQVKLKTIKIFGQLKKVVN